MNLKNFFFPKPPSKVDAFFNDEKFRKEVVEKAAKESTQQQVDFLKSIGQKFSK